MSLVVVLIFGFVAHAETPGMNPSVISPSSSFWLVMCFVVCATSSHSVVASLLYTTPLDFGWLRVPLLVAMVASRSNSSLVIGLSQYLWLRHVVYAFVVVACVVVSTRWELCANLVGGACELWTTVLMC